MNFSFRHIISRFIPLVMLTFVALTAFDASATTNRKERRAVSEGNELYKKGHFLEAAEKYQSALRIEPSSQEALYNLGLTYIRRANATQTDSLRQQLIKSAADAMASVAKAAKEKPNLAADALYNLGNIAFNSEDFSQAVEMYKSSLRIRPEDEKTRRNLRIAQKKIKDQNKDDQDKDQDQKEQEKEQQKEQQKEQNQQQQQQQQQQPEINPQAAEQILNAMENKENQTRARVNKSNNGQQAAGKAAASKRW